MAVLVGNTPGRFDKPCGYLLRKRGAQARDAVVEVRQLFRAQPLFERRRLGAHARKPDGAGESRDAM